ncbi:DNA-binding transcriptional dual regulator Crp [compost metagenome]
MTLFGPLQIFGHTCIDNSFTYFANEEVQAISIPSSDFWGLLDKDPSQWSHMGRMLMRQEREQLDFLAIQVGGSLTERVMNSVHHFAALHGVRASGKGAVHLRFTQQDLAQLLQVTRQSVSKVLKAWADTGAIELRYNAIVLRNTPAADEADGRHVASAQPSAGTVRPSSDFEELGCIERALKKSPGFAVWPPAPMERLLMSSRVGHHAHTQVVSSERTENPEILIVTSGEVIAHEISHAKERHGAMLAGPGHLIGMHRTFDHRSSRRYEFHAHGHVVAIHMSTRALLDILDEWPSLWRGMIQALLRQHEAMRITLRSQLLGSLRQRIAGTVARFAALNGIRSTPDGAVRVNISQKNLSIILRSTRQAVHKELRVLVKSGVIAIEYGAIVVLDLEMLQALADA